MFLTLRFIAIILLPIRLPLIKKFNLEEGGYLILRLLIDSIKKKREREGGFDGGGGIDM